MNVLRLSEIKQKCYLFYSRALGVEDSAIGTEDVEGAVMEHLQG